MCVLSVYFVQTRSFEFGVIGSFLFGVAIADGTSSFQNSFVLQTF